MKIDYSRHAIERMNERGISKIEVREALLKGQSRESQFYGIIKCIYYKKEERVIVIYRQERENFKIITIYKI